MTTAAWTGPAKAAGDADVLAAKEAAQHGRWNLVDTLRARLAGHPLEAYQEYWKLSGSVERADPAEVQAFLARYPGTPLAESVRREWLKVLGAAGSWDLFREQYPRLIGDDVEITCYSFEERLARSDAEVGAEARALFLAGREAPAACDEVFVRLAASGAISEADVWERLRKLLAAGELRDAKRADAMLPAGERFDPRLLDRAAADPARFLAREKSATRSRAGRELAIFALARLARSHPDEAGARLAAIEASLGADTAKYAWGEVAWQAAMNHAPEALDWYARAGDAPLTDSQIAWKARAAMRAGEWRTVLAAIQALSPERARESTWRYWRARALRMLGEREAADALLASLAHESGFYGLLAADDLGVASAPEWNGWHPAAEDLERVRAMPGIVRALALYRLGLDPEGAREWVWAVRGLGDHDLLAAAEIARLADIPDRAINTADKTLEVHDLAQRYPTPHRDALAAAARQWGVDPAIVFALVRQESRFRSYARSAAGARGLMQLMPKTARWIARRISLKRFRPDMLLKPELNLQMGAYYFRTVLAALGHPLLAAAAYNAGPARARRWRDEAPMEGAIFAETIPFNETRDYVKKVFANEWFYRSRLTGQVASMRQLLGTVPGRGGDSTGSFAENIP